MSSVRPYKWLRPCQPTPSGSGVSHRLVCAAAGRARGPRGNAKEARRHVKAANGLARRLGADRDDYGTEFGPTNVALHAVAVEVELGNAAEALRLANQVNAASLSSERQARFLVDVARAHAQRVTSPEPLPPSRTRSRSLPARSQIHGVYGKCSTIWSISPKAGRSPVCGPCVATPPTDSHNLAASRSPFRDTQAPPPYGQRRVPQHGVTDGIAWMPDQGGPFQVRVIPVDASRLTVLVVGEPTAQTRDGKAVLDRATEKPMWNLDVTVIGEGRAETVQLALPEGAFPRTSASGP